MRTLIALVLMVLGICRPVASEVIDATRGMDKAGYFYSALGLDLFWYPQSFGDLAAPTQGVDEGAAGDNGAHLGEDFDILGYYRPYIKNKLLLGIVLNRGIDSYNARNGNTFVINEYSLSASTLYFLQAQVGSGPFLRADLGYAALDDRYAGEDHLHTLTGLNTVAGLGWSWCAALKLSFLSQLDLCYLFMNFEGYGSIRLKGGILF